MVVVFPAPFTPTTMTTAGGSVTRGTGRSEDSRISRRCWFDHAAQFGGIVELMAFHALPDAIQNFVRRGDADIRVDERVLEFVEKIGVDLAAGDRVA